MKVKETPVYKAIKADGVDIERSCIIHEKLHRL